jgi:hypothetical protein
LNLFPNPASGVMNYSISNAENKNYSLQIFNALGELVKSENINNSSGQISLEKLETGIYLVQFMNANSIVTKEVVVR